MQAKPNINEVAGVYKCGAMYRNDNIAWESTLTVAPLAAHMTFQLSIHTKRYDENGSLTSEHDELDAVAEVFSYFPKWQAYVLRLHGTHDVLVQLRIPHRVFARQSQVEFEYDIEFYRKTFADAAEGEIEIWSNQTPISKF